MAETIHLTLKSNGQQLVGNSSQHSLDREDTIECLSFSQAMFAPRERGSMPPSGRRELGPILISKRIDRATPLLAQALAENRKLEAVFKFYRPSPAGDGTTEQFFSIELKNAFIQSAALSAHVGTNSLAVDHPMEEVSFVYSDVEWTYADGGISYADSWAKGR